MSPIFWQFLFWFFKTILRVRLLPYATPAYAYEYTVLFGRYVTVVEGVEWRNWVPPDCTSVICKIETRKSRRVDFPPAEVAERVYHEGGASDQVELASLITWLCNSASATHITEYRTPFPFHFGPPNDDAKGEDFPGASAAREQVHPGSLHQHE